MADPGALIPSVQTLVQLAVQSTTITYCYIQGLKTTPDELKSLIDVTKQLSGTLVTIREYVGSFAEDFDSEDAAFTAMNEPVTGCTKLLEDLLKNLDGAAAKSGVRRVLKSLTWPLKNEDTAKYVERLQWYASFFELVLSNNTYAVSQKIIEHAQLFKVPAESESVIKESAIDKDAQKQISDKNEMLEWMSKIGYKANHVQACELQQEGTGKWFSEGETFKSWTEGHPTTPFIWLSGLPGAGKTILTSSLISRKLEKTLAGDAVAYFYFDFKVPEKQQAIPFLRSIIRQLLSECKDIPPDVTSIYNRYRYSGKQATANELRSIFRYVSATFNKVFLMIDALDESVDWYLLSQLLLWMSSDQFNNIRMVVSSRRRKHISDDLEQSRFREVAIQNDQVGNLW